MKRLVVFLGVVVALVGFMTLNAQALPFINGTINFHSDLVTLNTGNVLTAKEITSISSDLHVAIDSGTYAALVPANTATPGAYTTPLVFSPQQATPFVLWSFLSGGNTFSFETTSWNPNNVVNVGGSQFLNLSGAGFASITGYADTPGTWSISITKTGKSTFIFETANSVAPVPEPATLLLLGAGMTGLVLYRRKKA